MARPTRTRVKGLRTGKFLRLIDEDPCALTFCDFALYLTSENDPDRAERYCNQSASDAQTLTRRLVKRALQAEPYDVRSLASYALFLEMVRHDYDAAQRVYEARNKRQLDEINRATVGRLRWMLRVARKSTPVCTTTLLCF